MELWFGRPACTSGIHPTTAAPPRALHCGAECTHQNLGDTEKLSRGHTGKQEEKKDVSQKGKISNQNSLYTQLVPVTYHIN